MLKKSLAVGVLCVTFATLFPAFGQELPAPTGIVNNIGKYISQLVPDLRSEIATSQQVRTILLEDGTIMTQECTLHKQEATLETMRRHLLCEEKRAGWPNVTFEEMYIGNTLFRKEDGAPWYQYDLSTNYPRNWHFFKLKEHSYWLERQYIEAYAQVPFAPTPTSTPGTWLVETQDFPMPFFDKVVQTLTHDWIEYFHFQKAFFSDNPEVTGTFYEGRNIGEGLFVMTGSSNLYSSLNFSLAYSADTLAITVETTPRELSAETPTLDYTLVREKDQTVAQFIRTESATRSITTGYTNVSTTGTLESPVVAPAQSLLASNDRNTGYDPCVAIQFTDVCGHWSQKWIGRAHAVGYIGQYKYADNPDYLLLPDEPVARAEFVHLLNESHSYDLLSLGDSFFNKSAYSKNDSLYTPSDVDMRAWYITPIQKALYLGIAVFQQNKTFRPNDTLNRAETMTFLARIIDQSLKQGETSLVQDYYSSWLDENATRAYAYFPDVALDSWFAPYVVFMYDMGLLDPNQSLFRPGSPVTRSEAITLIERLRQNMPKMLTYNFS